MKRIKSFIALTLALLLVFSLIACASTEKAPKLTITSDTAATIEVGAEYTLTYTTENVKNVTVTVTEKDSKTGGSYDETTKIFTATEAGEYTLTITAVNQTKQDVKTVVVTVIMPVDTTKPVITFEEGAQSTYTVAVNTDLILPRATVSDDRDGDISSSLDVGLVSQQGAKLTKADDVYTFNASTAGTYIVSYYAEDLAGNNDEEFVTVNVTPTKAETEVAIEDNAIANLNTSTKTYIENFAKGYASDLAKGLNYNGNVKARIDGGNDAIAGNSLIMDYSECVATTNTSFFFSGLDAYLKPGKWTIEMDINKISGNIPGFYVSFVFDGDNSGDNTQYTINDGLNHIKYEGIKNFDMSKTWHFRVFTYTGDSSFNYSGLKLVIDNVKITWKEVENAFVTRDGEAKELTGVDIDTSYTLTGTDDNYTALGGNGGGSYVDINKLVTGDLLTSEQVANLISANGFNSDYAIRFTTQINNFEAIKNLFIDPAYDYTITMKIYAPNGNGAWYLFITDGSGAQQLASQLNQAGESDAGVKTITRTILGHASYINIGLYTGGSSEVYIGDITVSRTIHEVPSTTPKGYSVGQTWTLTDITPLSANASKVNTADVILADDSLLSTIPGFGATAVLFEDADDSADKTGELFRAGDYFETSCDYKITYVMYIESLSGGPLMARYDSNFLAITDGSEIGLVTKVVDFSGAVDFFSFYTQGATTVKMYLASIEIELVKIN